MTNQRRGRGTLGPVRWVIGALLAGCSFHGPSVGGIADGSAGAQDTGLDTLIVPPGDTCLGSGNFTVCVPTPTGPRIFGNGAANETIDTDMPGCILVDQPGGSKKLCVIAGTTITIGPKILYAAGSHPLVLFASDTIFVSGGVDVGSHYMGQASGAGDDPGSCESAMAGTSDTNGGGGGAGGTFTTVGGNGGNGAGGGMSAGAVADPTVSPTSNTLRGGCPGSSGGDGAVSMNGGMGNHGGGAVMLLAQSSIAIAGFVNASGAGGNFGKAMKGGGGGGGSGGMIVLDAPIIAMTGPGHLIANGGGGGGGAGGAAGMPGLDPDPLVPDATLAKALGGGGAGGGGGMGGSGATQIAAAGTAVNTGAGAGGGGGGLGLIRVLTSQTIGGQNSPTAQH